MLYDLNNDFDREKFKERCDDLMNKRAKVELNKKHPPRSMKQNNYLYVLLGYFASEFGSTIQDVKENVFKAECNPDIFYYDYTNRRGEVVKRLKSTTSLDTAELSLAIERFRNRSSAEYALYLPAPNEEEALFYAQKQFESYKEFA